MHVSKWTGVKVGGLVLVAAVVAGCGGGGGSETSNSVSPPASGNARPTISGQPAGSIVAGQSYSFQPSASDPNGDALTFSASNVPAWATFNSSTGRLTGTPSAADVATYGGITISVSDGQLSASLNAFSIAVVAVGAGSGRATVSWTPPTANSDGSALTNLTGYQVYYGQDANYLDQSINVTNPSVTTYVVDNLGSGTWYFSVTAIASTGASSMLSTVVSKTI